MRKYFLAYVYEDALAVFDRYEKAVQGAWMESPQEVFAVEEVSGPFVAETDYYLAKAALDCGEILSVFSNSQEAADTSTDGVVVHVRVSRSQELAGEL